MVISNKKNENEDDPNIVYLNQLIDRILNKVIGDTNLENSICFNEILEIESKGGVELNEYLALYIWVMLREKSIKLNLNYKFIIEKFYSFLEYNSTGLLLFNLNTHNNNNNNSVSDNNNLIVLKKVYKDSIVYNTFLQKDIKPIQKYYLSNYQIIENDVSLSIDYPTNKTNKTNTITTPSQLIKVYNEFEKESMVIKHNYADKSKFTRQDITEYEKTHPFIQYKNYIVKESGEKDEKACLKLGINKIGDWSINPTLELFKDCFNSFTKGVLNGIDWGLGGDGNTTKVIASGGSITSCLNTLPKDILFLYHEMMMTKRCLNHLNLPFQAVELIFEYSKPYHSFFKALEEHYHSMDSPYLTSDLDLFFITPSIHEGKKKIEEVALKIQSNMMAKKDCTDLRFVRTQNSITIVSSYPYRPVQLMIFFIRSIEDLILFYDLDCVSTAFNGDNVFMLPRSINAFNKRLNMVPPSLFNEENDRIYKYCYRGFNTICFENCIHKTRCDKKKYLYSSILENDSITKDINNRPIFQISSYNVDSASIFNFPYGPEKTFNDVLIELKENNYINSDKFKQSLFDNEQPKTSSGDDEDELLEDEYFNYQILHPCDWRFKFIKINHLSSKVSFKCYVCGDNLEETKNRLCNECIYKNESTIRSFSYKIRLSELVLNQKYAIVTGARIKIGYHIAVSLLKSGFNVIVTTRFPNCAFEKYKLEFKKSPEVLKRLFIYGIDFRNVLSVQQFINTVKLKFPRIDVLINNAAQTIRRPRAYYYDLLQNEKRLLLENVSDSGSVNSGLLAISTINGSSSSPTEFIEKILIDCDKEESNFELFPSGKFDEHNEQLDLRSSTSWTASVENISVVEVAEVLLVNSTIPFMLISQLSSMMGTNKLISNEEEKSEIIDKLKSASDVAKYEKGKITIRRNDWSIIVNVTSPEGDINNEINSLTGVHAHTNMAKSSLQMLTKTIAYQFEKKNIYVCTGDTGWVSDMQPKRGLDVPSREPPLSELDGANRILFPVYHHFFESNRFPSGVNFVNFEPTFLS